ncbi:MAG: hypothetical protein K2Q01_11050, partial [Rickettsiales bacterium]|nr:hypothetical protein [Rickettsiales bacterium]
KNTAGESQRSRMEALLLERIAIDGEIKKTNTAITETIKEPKVAELVEKQGNLDRMMNDSGANPEMIADLKKEVDKLREKPDTVSGAESYLRLNKKMADLRQARSQFERVIDQRAKSLDQRPNLVADTMSYAAFKQADAKITDLMDRAATSPEARLELEKLFATNKKFMAVLEKQPEGAGKKEMLKSFGVFESLEEFQAFKMDRQKPEPIRRPEANKEILLADQKTLDARYGGDTAKELARVTKEFKDEFGVDLSTLPYIGPDGKTRKNPMTNATVTMADVQNDLRQQVADKKEQIRQLKQWANPPAYVAQLETAVVRAELQIATNNAQLIQTTQMTREQLVEKYRAETQEIFDRADEFVKKNPAIAETYGQDARAAMEALRKDSENYAKLLKIAQAEKEKARKAFGDMQKAADKDRENGKPVDEAALERAENASLAAEKKATQALDAFRRADRNLADSYFAATAGKEKLFTQDGLKNVTFGKDTNGSFVEVTDDRSDRRFGGTDPMHPNPQNPKYRAYGTWATDANGVTSFAVTSVQMPDKDGNWKEPPRLTREQLTREMKWSDVKDLETRGPRNPALGEYGIVFTGVLRVPAPNVTDYLMGSTDPGLLFERTSAEVSRVKMLESIASSQRFNSYGSEVVGKVKPPIGISESMEVKFTADKITVTVPARVIGPELETKADSTTYLMKKEFDVKAEAAAILADPKRVEKMFPDFRTRQKDSAALEKAVLENLRAQVEAARGDPDKLTMLMREIPVTEMEQRSADGVTLRTLKVDRPYYNGNARTEEEASKDLRKINFVFERGPDGKMTSKLGLSAQQPGGAVERGVGGYLGAAQLFGAMAYNGTKIFDGAEKAIRIDYSPSKPVIAGTGLGVKPGTSPSTRTDTPQRDSQNPDPKIAGSGLGVKPGQPLAPVPDPADPLIPASPMGGPVNRILRTPIPEGITVYISDIGKGEGIPNPKDGSVLEVYTARYIEVQQGQENKQSRIAYEAVSDPADPTRVKITGVMVDGNYVRVQTDYTNRNMLESTLYNAVKLAQDNPAARSAPSEEIMMSQQNAGSGAPIPQGLGLPTPPPMPVAPAVPITAGATPPVDVPAPMRTSAAMPAPEADRRPDLQSRAQALAMRLQSANPDEVLAAIMEAGGDAELLAMVGTDVGQGQDRVAKINVELAATTQAVANAMAQANGETARTAKSGALAEVKTDAVAPKEMTKEMELALNMFKTANITTGTVPMLPKDNQTDVGRA